MHRSKPKEDKSTQLGTPMHKSTSRRTDLFDQTFHSRSKRIETFF